MNMGGGENASDNGSGGYGGGENGGNGTVNGETGAEGGDNNGEVARFGSGESTSLNYDAGGGGGGWFGGNAARNNGMAGVNAGGGGGSGFVFSNFGTYENVMNSLNIKSGEYLSGKYLLTGAKTIGGNIYFREINAQDDEKCEGIVGNDEQIDYSNLVNNNNCEQGHYGNGAIRITRLKDLNSDTSDTPVDSSGGN